MVAIDASAIVEELAKLGTFDTIVECAGRRELVQNKFVTGEWRAEGERRKGMELYAIRAAHPGEKTHPRQINWAQSARFGAEMVNVYVPEVPLHIGIFLDMSRSMENIQKRLRSLQVVAALLHSARSFKDAVTVYCCGERMRVYSPTATRRWPALLDIFWNEKYQGIGGDSFGSAIKIACFESTLTHAVVISDFDFVDTQKGRKMLSDLSETTRLIPIIIKHVSEEIPPPGWFPLFAVDYENIDHEVVMFVTPAARKRIAERQRLSKAVLVSYFAKLTGREPFWFGWRQNVYDFHRYMNERSL